MTAKPEHITLAELESLLRAEVQALPADLKDWWQKHGVRPTVVVHGQMAHFMVAQCETHALFFADNEDEYGVGELDGPTQ